MNYRKKSLSVLLIALISVSGLSFLSFVNPAHAVQNASPPTVKGSPGVVVGGVASPFSVSVSNPTSNAYAITALTVVRPSSSWTFGGGPTCGALLTLVAANSTAAVKCTGSLPPGFSDTLDLGTMTGPVSSASSPPVSGTFSTILIDAGSAPASYTGPSFVVKSIAPTSVTVTPSAPVSYTAGGSAITVTATLTSAQPGVPIAFSITSGTYPTAGFTASLTPTSGNTGSSGTLSTSFKPSNFAGDSTNITATVTSTISNFSAVITTVAGAPSKLTFNVAAAGVGATHYETTFGTDVLLVGGAEVASPGILYSIADAFNNPIAFSTFASVTVTITALTGAGRFNLSATTPSAVTCPVGGWTCPTSGLSQSLPFAYFQSKVYGTIGKLSATVTTTGPASSLSGTSGNIITSTFTGSAPVPSPSSLVNVTAGSTFTVKANITTAGPTAQQGVPVTLFLNTTSSTADYAGTFQANGLQNITVTTDSSGIASAKFTVDKVANSNATFYSKVKAPTDADSTAQLGPSGDSAKVRTIAGTATTFKIKVTYDSALSLPASSAVPSATLYVNVLIADLYENAATNPGPQQIQITLSKSGGVLSATNVYITSGGSDTKTVFGPIAWTLPNSTGPVTITASGVLGGVSKTTTKTINIVSALPTLAVTSPAPLNGVIYSASTSVVFFGQANVSIGYQPGVNISGVGYKVGTGAWLSAIISPGQTNVVWSLVATFPVGLSTIQFNASDTELNTVVSAVFSVLVDTSPPTIAFVTAENATLEAGGKVAATITDSLGDLNGTSVSATRNGTAVVASAITVTGTNNPGSSVTYSVTISLPAGYWEVKLSASDLAGNAAAPKTLHVTVVVLTTQSFTVVGTPTLTTVAGNPVLSVTYSNNLPTAETVFVLATATCAGGVTSFPTASLTSVAAGGTAVALLNLSGLPHGSCTVSFFVVSSTNVVISETGTATVTL